MSSLAHDRAWWGWSGAASRTGRRSLSRADKTRRARWRLALLLSAIIIAATALAGCSALPAGARLQERDDEHDAARDREIDHRRAARGAGALESRSKDAAGSVAFDAPDGPATPTEVPPATQLLAEQSQRDVDLLLAARRNGSGGSGAPPASVMPGFRENPARGAAAQAPAAPRRVVVWNDPPRPAAVPQHPQSTPAVLSIDSANAGKAATPPPPAATQPTASESTATDSGIAADSLALQPDRMKQLAVDLARELYAAGAYSEQPLRELVVIAAMNMVDAERKLDPAAIPDLTDDEREVLANLQRFFADLGETLDDSEASEIPAAVADAAAKLRESLVHEPQLALPTMALCTRVGGFSDYAPFDDYNFIAGVEQKAIVYLEVDDFVSEINDKGEFVTELSQQLTIYSERDGIPVWKDDWQSAVDVTKDKRQDFFTVQVITLPKTLAIGQYTLKVRVRDEKSKAEAETSVRLEMRAK